MKSFTERLLDLVFPKNCQGCRAEGTYLCTSCQNKIKIPAERCLVCSKQSFLGQVHPDCVAENTFLAGIMVAAPYERQEVQNLIWHFKYHSVREISDILSTIMADYFISRNLLQYFASAAVVPVPLHKRRKRFRGFNQAEMLASDFTRKLGLEYLPILERIRNIKSQVDLERQERWGNVKGVFASQAWPSLGERKIILIDDVAATGATLNDCARALATQKPLEVWGFVVARN